VPRPYGEGRRPSSKGKASRLEPTRSFRWPFRCEVPGCPLEATPGTQRCGPHHGPVTLNHRALVRRVAACLLPVVPEVLGWFVERGRPEERSVAFEALNRLSDRAAQLEREPTPRTRPLTPERLFGFPVDVDLLVEENFGGEGRDRRGYVVHLKRCLLAVELATHDEPLYPPDFTDVSRL
jgi:hypothetical protein